MGDFEELGHFERQIFLRDRGVELLLSIKNHLGQLKRGLESLRPESREKVETRLEQLQTRVEDLAIRLRTSPAFFEAAFLSDQHPQRKHAEINTEVTSINQQAITLREEILHEASNASNRSAQSMMRERVNATTQATDRLEQETLSFNAFAGSFDARNLLHPYGKVIQPRKPVLIQGYPRLLGSALKHIAISSRELLGIDKRRFQVNMKQGKGGVQITLEPPQVLTAVQRQQMIHTFTRADHENQPALFFAQHIINEHGGSVEVPTRGRPALIIRIPHQEA